MTATASSSSARVAIVTGASRGLGRAIALRLAADGAVVVVTARTDEALERVAEEARANGAPAALAVATDLSKAGEPERVVAAAAEAFGRVDIVVNNAGATKRGDFLTLTDEDHVEGFALKYHATVRFCRAAWPHLARSTGAIVNISGIGAQTPEPDFTVGGPVNSALLNFTKAIAKRAQADGIRVNAVCPGHIATDRLLGRLRTRAKADAISEEEASRRIREELGIQRFGDPADIANMVAYLCGPEGAYIQGATMIVDGGATPGL